MENPELAPALERLHRQRERAALGEGLRRSHPGDPVSAASQERLGAWPLRIGERQAGLARLPRGRTQGERAHGRGGRHGDRKSTRLNSSHEWISYAVFCLKKKKNRKQ